MGKPDPRALQETIRQLREELKSLRHQVSNQFDDTLSIKKYM